MGKQKETRDDSEVEESPAKKQKGDSPRKGHKKSKHKETKSDRAEAADDPPASQVALSQALPKPKTSPRKPGTAAVQAAVDVGRYGGGDRKLVKVTELNWDREAKLGQTRCLDDDEVELKIKSLTQNPPDVPVMVTVWPNEDGQLFVISGQHVSMAALKIYQDYLRRSVPAPKWCRHVNAETMKHEMPLEDRENYAGDKNAMQHAISKFHTSQVSTRCVQYMLLVAYVTCVA